MLRLGVVFEITINKGEILCIILMYKNKRYMNFTIVATVIFLLIMLPIINKILPSKNLLGADYILPIGLCLAFITRISFAFFGGGFEVDLNLFQAWGSLVHTEDFSNVYKQTHTYLDYPPGYLYVLYVLEAVRELFNLNFSSSAYFGILKLPAILADLACGYLIYIYAKKDFDIGQASVLALTYLFCPMTILDSAVWGQIDAVTALILVSSLILLQKNKFIPSGIIFGLGLITKPQMLIFIPVYFFYTLFSKQFKGLILGVISALATAFLLALPFSGGLDFTWLFRLYGSTIDYYGYYTINAYNMWALFGFNWKELPEQSFIITLLPTLGATVLSGFYLYKFKEKKESIFTSAALIMGTVFFFAPKMHERYLFPMFILVLLAFICSKNLYHLYTFVALSSVSFVNTAYVLYLDNSYVSPTSPQIIILSAINLAGFIFFLYYIFWNKQLLLVEFSKNYSTELKIDTDFSESKSKRKIKKKDIVFMSVIVVFYSFFAFYNLGANTNANTSWTPSQGEVVVFKVEDQVKSLMYLSGITAQDDRPRIGANFEIEISNDNETYISIGNLSDVYVYEWKEFALNQYVGYIKITAKDSASVLNEVAFTNADGNAFLEFEPVAGITANLIDEQSAVPLYTGFYYSMYFDEIYHARTAYEHILDVEPYENTHPPFGKYIIAFFIELFGMTPFAWRFGGALFGVLMLPVFYHIVLRLFSCSFIAAGATMLFAFDFMHFTQTRIATIDTYAVFFILLMYDCMLVFVQQNLLKAKLKSLLIPLFLSGLFMGLGVSAKWTCAYGALGLAFLLFYKIIVDYIKADEDDKHKLFALYKKLCVYCIAFFIVIPFAIYFICFLPITTLPHNINDFVGSFINYQEHMLSYHSGLVAEHPFSSAWYEWPLAIKNIWYYISNNYEGTGMVSSISSMGNPVLWISGLLAMFYAVYIYIKKGSSTALFIIAGFLAVYFPWVLVPRLTFVYHYFTAVPFIIIAIAYVYKIYVSTRITDNSISIKDKSIFGAFVLVNFALFILFFPAISGSPTSYDYLEMLSWYPTWTLS